MNLTWWTRINGGQSYNNISRWSFRPNLNWGSCTGMFNLWNVYWNYAIDIYIYYIYTEYIYIYSKYQIYIVISSLLELNHPPFGQENGQTHAPSGAWFCVAATGRELLSCQQKHPLLQGWASSNLQNIRYGRYFTKKYADETNHYEGKDLMRVYKARLMGI